MQNTTKFGILGHGRIGARHAAMIQAHPNAELVAVCDLDAKKEIKGVPFYTDAEAFLAQNPNIEVVCICTPNGSHASHSIAVLSANKHVVLEKPMALHTRDCERVLMTALQRDKHVFCVMQNRYSPPAVWLKELVESNKLGEIHMVTVNCFWNRDKAYYDTPWKGTLEHDGGVLFTQFSHFVDMIYWLFGEIDNERATFATKKHAAYTEFEDTGTVQFDFERGGMGTFNFSTAVHEKNFESAITIVAEKGTVKVGGQYMNELEYCNIEGYEKPILPPSNPPNQYGAYQGSAANHGFVIQNVIDKLHNDGQITTNAIEGMKVVEMIVRMYNAGHRPLRKLTPAKTEASL